MEFWGSPQNPPLATHQVCVHHSMCVHHSVRTPGLIYVPNPAISHIYISAYILQQYMFCCYCLHLFAHPEASCMCHSLQCVISELVLATILKPKSKMLPHFFHLGPLCVYLPLGWSFCRAESPFQCFFNMHTYFFLTLISALPPRFRTSCFRTMAVVQI